MKPMVIAAGAAVVLISAGAWMSLRGGKAEAPNLYKLAPVQRGSVRKTVSASGTLQPWTTVDVKSKAGGRIDLLAVDLGTVVKTGQIIAKIDPTDSKLTYDQARADTESARAKQAQSTVTYRMQVGSSLTSVQEAQAQVDQARANYRAAQARERSARDANKAQPSLTTAAIAQAKASYDSAKQDRARLVATQTQDRANAKAAYDQAVATDANAQAQVTRQKALLAKGYVSRQTVDQAQSAADISRSQVISAKAKLDTLEAELAADREASDAKVSQANAALTSAQTQSVDVRSKQNAESEAVAATLQAKAALEQALAALAEAYNNRQNDQLKKLDITNSRATTARAVASLTNAQSTLDQTTVRAPAEGVVLTKYVEQGTIITSGMSLSTSGTSIVQIGEISRMYVEVAVDETDIANVKLGQRVDISMDAYPDIKFSGKVYKINPQAQVESNVTTVHVRVEVDNKNPDFKLLKPAMNATCDFVIGEATDGLTVPAEAVKSEGTSKYVEVAKGGKPADPKLGAAAAGAVVAPSIEKRTIEVGVEGNEVVEVKSGLQEGEQVVVSKVDTTPEEATTTKAAFGGGGPPGPPGGNRGGKK